MIDTIKLFIPASKEAIYKIQNRAELTKRTDQKTGRVVYEYCQQPIEIGFFKQTILIYQNKTRGDGIFVEFSLPKYTRGNNVEMIHYYQVLPALEFFKKEIERQFETQISNLAYWEIQRLDICYNWTLKSLQEVQSLMNFIQRIDYPRKKKYIYDTSVMYKGSAYTIKFYLKGPEYLKNNKDSTDENHFEYIDWSKRILRFEVQFRKRQLIELFSNNLFVNTFPFEETEFVLNYYLNSVFKYISKENMKLEDVRQKIANHFTPAKTLRLYQFYRAYYLGEDTKILYERGGLNRSTIYRYKSDLKSVGVSYRDQPTDAEPLNLSQLTIPSDRAFFTLLDYKLSVDYS